MTNLPLRNGNSWRYSVFMHLFIYLMYIVAGSRPHKYPVCTARYTPQHFAYAAGSAPACGQVHHSRLQLPSAYTAQHWPGSCPGTLRRSCDLGTGKDPGCTYRHSTGGQGDHRIAGPIKADPLGTRPRACCTAYRRYPPAGLDSAQPGSAGRHLQGPSRNDSATEPRTAYGMLQRHGLPGAAIPSALSKRIGEVVYKRPHAVRRPLC